MNPLALLDFGSTLLDKFFPDKDAAAKAKIELFKMQASGELSKLQAQAGIITAEANSEHLLAAIWRPITMLVFVFIIANNYIIYPYLSLFIDNAPEIKLPEHMWDLLKIGIGGYTIGRTIEKSVKSYREK